MRPEAAFRSHVQLSHRLRSSGQLLLFEGGARQQKCLVFSALFTKLEGEVDKRGTKDHKKLSRISK